MAKNVDSVVAIFGTVKDAGDTKIRIDPETGSLVIVPWQHFLIHKGLLYAAAYMHESISKNGVADMIVSACPNHSLHVFSAKWVSGGKAHLELYGAPVWEEGTGTEIYASNMLFGSPNTSTTLIIADPVLTSPGVLAHKQLMAGGVLPYLYGGHHEIAHEWVLPAGGKVLVRIRNLANTTVDISWQLNFFENGDNILWD